MGSCSLFAVINLAGFRFPKIFLNTKVGTADSEQDPNFI